MDVFVDSCVENDGVFDRNRVVYGIVNIVVNIVFVDLNGCSKGCGRTKVKNSLEGRVFDSVNGCVGDNLKETNDDVVVMYVEGTGDVVCEGFISVVVIIDEDVFVDDFGDVVVFFNFDVGRMNKT